jgi:hypothetical protein
MEELGQILEKSSTEQRAARKPQKMYRNHVGEHMSEQDRISR